MSTAAPLRQAIRIGAFGCRILVTLNKVWMTCRDTKKGFTTLNIGDSQSIALAVEHRSSISQ
ncbi:MAG: hypothetical protein H6974_06785 [Gammaproteobacteria bacterium]|nr:hypothetical protein [Gammaproteobacteria bacterium]